MKVKETIFTFISHTHKAWTKKLNAIFEKDLLLESLEDLLHLISLMSNEDILIQSN